MWLRLIACPVEKGNGTASVVLFELHWVPLTTSNLKICSLKMVLVISELFKCYCQSEVIFSEKIICLL